MIVKSDVYKDTMRLMCWIKIPVLPQIIHVCKYFTVVFFSLEIQVTVTVTNHILEVCLLTPECMCF